MIYFDSAATTLQKPESVAKAVGEAVTTLASPADVKQYQEKILFYYCTVKTKT